MPDDADTGLRVCLQDRDFLVEDLRVRGLKHPPVETEVDPLGQLGTQVAIPSHDRGRIGHVPSSELARSGFRGFERAASPLLGQRDYAKSHQRRGSSDPENVLDRHESSLPKSRPPPAGAPTVANHDCRL